MCTCVFIYTHIHIYVHTHIYIYIHAWEIWTHEAANQGGWGTETVFTHISPQPVHVSVHQKKAQGQSKNMIDPHGLMRPSELVKEIPGRQL